MTVWVDEPYARILDKQAKRQDAEIHAAIASLEADQAGEGAQGPYPILGALKAVVAPAEDEFS